MEYALSTKGLGNELPGKPKTKKRKSGLLLQNMLQNLLCNTQESRSKALVTYCVLLGPLN